MKPKGWRNESRRHSLASKGIKTAQKIPKNLITRYNKSKDRDILPNRGMETKRIILDRKDVLVGSMVEEYSGRIKSILLDFKIEEIDLSTQAIYNGDGELLYIGNTKMTQDGKKVSKYTKLSISGSIGRGNAMIEGGQIQDTLKKGLNDPNFRFKNREAVKEILQIWDDYHLNDLKAGTTKQEKALDSWKGRPEGFSYEQDVKFLKSKKLYVDKGYKYGSKWLVGDLPSGIATKLSNAISRARGD